jgi:hypothetical protein
MKNPITAALSGALLTIAALPAVAMGALPNDPDHYRVERDHGDLDITTERRDQSPAQGFPSLQSATALIGSSAVIAASPNKMAL